MPADIVQFIPRGLPTDGGKSRILRKRGDFHFRIPAEPIVDCRDDLIMGHSDPGMPSDSPYFAPDSDPA